MNKTILAIALASLTSHASISYAQSSDETVVVTGNRFEQQVDALTSPVDIITREDIEVSQAKSLLEVLRRLPGIQVAANGGFGQTQSLFVRGTNSSHVLVMIDGVRFGSATTGQASISSLPLVGIERIEFLRGPRAAVYGSDAIGGVINIITDNKRSETKVSASTGSNDYYQGKLFSAGNLSKDLHASVGVEGVKTRGYSVKTGAGLNDDDGYESKNITLATDYQVSPTWKAGFLALAQDGHVEYDASGHGDADKDERLLNFVTKLEYTGAQYQSHLHVAFNQDKSKDYAYSSLTQTDRSELSWDNQYAVSNELSVSSGANWYKDDISKSSKAYDETSRTNFALYLNGNYHAALFDLEAAVRSDDNQRYGQNTTWQLGAGYNLSSVYRVTANVGTAFKAPTFNQLYYPGYGTPDLEPEESKNYEMALLAYYSVTDLRLTLYRNEVTNLIVYDSATYKPMNYGEVDITGVEVSAEFATGDIDHTVSYDYTDAEDQETHNQLARRAKHSAKWNARYTWDQWAFDLSYVYQGKRYDDSDNDDGLDPYSLVDFAATYQWTNGIELQGKVTNLLDADYETADGYNTPDRQYFATVSYQF